MFRYRLQLLFKARKSLHFDSLTVICPNGFHHPKMHKHLFWGGKKRRSFWYGIIGVAGAGGRLFSTLCPGRACQIPAPLRAHQTGLCCPAERSSFQCKPSSPLHNRALKQDLSRAAGSQRASPMITQHKCAVNKVPRLLVHPPPSRCSSIASRSWLSFPYLPFQLRASSAPGSCGGIPAALPHAASPLLIRRQSRVTGRRRR